MSEGNKNPIPGILMESSSRILLSSFRGCISGDAIHQDPVVNYGMVLEDFSGEKGLSYSELEGIYNSIAGKVISLGYPVDEVAKFQGNFVGNGSYREVREITEKSSRILRIKIQRKTYYDYVSVDTQVARIGAIVQNLLVVKYGDLRFINFLKKRLRSSISSMSGGHLKPYFSGYVLQDMEYYTVWGEGNRISEIITYLNSKLSVVNQGLESGVVLGFSDGGNSRLMSSDYNMYLGEIDREIFKDLVERQTLWEGNDSRVMLRSESRASVKLMVRRVKVREGTFRVFISQRGEKWLVGVVARGEWNPYLWLKGLYPKVKLTNIYQNSNFVVYGTYQGRGNSKEKCSCGLGLRYDLVRGEWSCPECRIKQLMGMYVRM